jgi:hypothetical protein
MRTYQTTVQYDEHKLRGIARALFISAWWPLFPWVLPAAVAVLAIGAMISLHYTAGRLLAAAVALLVLLNLTWWPYVYRGYLQRFSDHWRGGARLTVTEEGIAIAFADRQVAVPWVSITKLHEGPDALILFISRANAIVIPTAELPRPVLALIKDWIVPR